jgi:hypothetical protein
MDGLEYRKNPAAVTIRLFTDVGTGGVIKRIDYGQLVPKNLPEFYKSIGAVTQKKFETAFKVTQQKLEQLNPPDLPAKNRADAVESLLQWVAKTAVTFTPEVKAYKEMESQISDANASIKLVEKAVAFDLLPAQFSNDLNFKENLMNYVLDGTFTASGAGERLENYNAVIKAVGNEIYKNREKILTGSYKRKVKEITKIYTAPRGLDFQNMGPAKIVGIEQQKIEPTYKEPLEKYNNSSSGCDNCPVIISPKD